MKLHDYLKIAMKNKNNKLFSYSYEEENDNNDDNEILTGKAIETFQLKLINNTIIKGFIDNDEIEMTVQNFKKIYPRIAKKILPILKKRGNVKFTVEYTISQK